MPTLHYGTAEIPITAKEASSLCEDPALSKPGLHSINLDGQGWIHLVTGPGIPIWIDERDATDSTMVVMR